MARRGGSVFFQGIREIVAAYHDPPMAQDPAVNTAVEVLQTSNAIAALGFFGRNRAPDTASVAVRLVQEQGHALTHDQTLEFVELLRKLDERAAVRRRFIVQIIVTAVVLALVVAIIVSLVPASDDLKNVAYGLLGTTVGYWLK